MKKAIVFALFGLISLFWISLVTGLEVFEPWYRISINSQVTPPSTPGEMSWDSYKKIKLAFGSFDLFNGLTKQDLETMKNTDPSLGFYYLMACLWLALGLRFGRRRPRQE
jgi:hypothetical protein